MGFSLEDGNSFVEEGNRKFEWIFIKTLKNFFFHETKKKLSRDLLMAAWIQLPNILVDGIVWKLKWCDFHF